MSKETKSLSQHWNNIKSFFGQPFSIQEHGKNFFFSQMGAIFQFKIFNQKKMVDDGYGSNADLYGVANFIINNAAEIPWKLLKMETINGVQQKVEVTEGDFYNFIHKPNEFDTGKSFRRDSVGYRILTGDSFWLKEVPIGFKHVRELSVVASIFVEPIVDKNDILGRVRSYKLKFNGKQRIVDREEMTQISLFNPTSYGLTSGRGLSPLQAGGHTIEASNDINIAHAHMIKNNGSAGFITDKSQRAMTEKEKEALKEMSHKKFGQSKEFNSLVITTSDLNYVPIGTDPGKLKMVESGTVKLRQFCNLVQLDSSMFNDPGNRTQNNMKESIRTAWTRGVIPVAQMDVDEFQQDIVPGWNERDGEEYFVELDTSGIEALQEDQNKRAQKNRVVAMTMTETVEKVGEKKISADSAVEILVRSLGISEDEATKIVGSTANLNDGTGDT